MQRTNKILEQGLHRLRRHRVSSWGGLESPGRRVSSAGFQLQRMSWRKGERERERGREEEKERERSPYMGTCADNMWQWLRGQQRSDTRQMEEIKHGTERVPEPWKQLLFHSKFAQNLARFPFLPKPSKMCVLNSTWLWVRPVTLAGWGLNPLKSFLWRTEIPLWKKKEKTGLISQEFPISLQST